MILKVVFLGNGRAIRAAKGHMPFAGHRTQQEVREDAEQRRHMREYNKAQAKEACSR